MRAFTKLALMGECMLIQSQSLTDLPITTMKVDSRNYLTMVSDISLCAFSTKKGNTRNFMYIGLWHPLFFLTRTNTHR